MCLPTTPRLSVHHPMLLHITQDHNMLHPKPLQSYPRHRLLRNPPTMLHLIMLRPNILHLIILHLTMLHLNMLLLTILHLNMHLLPMALP